MGTTIAGPTTTQATEILHALPPIVETRKTWADDWEIDPSLQFVSASIRSAGAGMDTCTLKRRYGNLRQSWQDDYAAEPSKDLLGWWVRLRFIGDADDPEDKPVTQWVGQISGSGRDVIGSDDSPAGDQQLAAYGPQRLLSKIDIDKSWWMVDTFATDAGGNLVDPKVYAERELGWVPDMNGRDSQRLLVGNRSEKKHATYKSADEAKGANPTAYMYGGEDVWTNAQYLIYLLGLFVDKTADGGPAWWLAGQTDLLDGMQDTIRMGATQTAAKVIRKLIPLEAGIDYRIVPAETDDLSGFEIRVFSLATTERSFAGQTLPRNPDEVRIDATDAIEHPSIRIEQTSDQRYARIRVVGRRIISCCSLFGSEVTPRGGSLIPGWTDDLEAAYLAAAGASVSEEATHDRVRRADQFRSVFRLFRAPDDWTFDDGWAAPKIDTDGSVKLQSTGIGADYQRAVRRTLTWIPLLEGWDYSTDPATNNNPASVPDTPLPLAVWLYDVAADRSVLADEVGLSVQANPHDLGVFVRATPNHLLALNHWAGAAGNVPTNDPKYDHEHLIATVAFESDQRFGLEYAVPGADDDGSVKTIEVPDAEMWWLAAHTVVGVDLDGVLQLSGNSSRVLRNDADRLHRVMAGAIARYADPRARAVMTGKGLLAWGDMVGQALTTIETGGSERAQGIVTSVDWFAGDESAGAGASGPTTIIRAGYAR